MEAIQDSVSDLSEWTHERPGLERFRCFDVAAIGFGHSQVILRANTTRTVRLLPEQQARQLLGMSGFRTMVDHAESMRIRSFAPSAPTDMLSTLRAWTADGYLTSERELRARVAAAARAPSVKAARTPNVEFVGIPTRNRDVSLERALRSYIANADAFGRSPVFIIADGSPPDGRSKNASRLQSIQRETGAKIRHIDVDEKTSLLHRIVEHAGCPYDTVEFALFGHRDLASNFGANRNTLLLASIGHLSVQVDDDTQLPLLAPPLVESGVELSSAVDPSHYWYEGDQALQASGIEKDFLGMHESLLGRSIGECLLRVPEDDLVIGAMEGGLFRDAVSGKASVAVTFVGHAGDAGVATNIARLFAEGPSFERLIRPGYEARILSRAVLRTVTRPTIGDGLFCMAVNIGLDARSLLPPFMPAGRNEDGVFSCALFVMAGAGYRGFVSGGVVKHSPMEQRDAFESPIRFNGFKANDLLSRLIVESGAHLSAGGRIGIRRMGRHLCDLASAPQSDFNEYMRSLIARTLGSGAAQIERIQSERRGRSAALDADLAIYLASVEEFACSRDPDAPIDLSGEADERRSLFRQLVFAYGELVTYWPDIVESARITNTIEAGHG